MRWFIEVSRLGEDTPLEKYCLEAKQWQAALQEARKRRGDTGPLSKFSIELLEHGYRAVDPSQKIRYLVNKAPPDASLSQPPPPGPGAAAAPGSFPTPTVPSEPVIKSTEDVAVSTDPMASPAPHSDPLASAPKTDPMASLPPESHAPRTDPLPQPPPIPPDEVPPIGAGTPSSTTQPMSALGSPSEPPRPATHMTQRSIEAAREPDFQVVKKREEEPTEKTPMLYREYAYAVRPGTERASTEVLLWLRFRELRTALEQRSERKFIQLAVFDHVFEKKPARAPIATLMWKDWRGDAVVQFPDPEGPVISVAPPPVTAPPPAAEAAVTLPPTNVVSTEPAPVALTEPGAPPTILTAPQQDPAPAVSQPFAPAPSSPTASQRPLAEEVLGSASVAAPAAGAAPAPSGPVTTPLTPGPAAAAQPAPVEAAKPAPTPSAPPPPSEPAKPAPAPAAAAAPPAPTPATAPLKRRADEDLIGELFESMHDLHFMPDMMSGVEFVLGILNKTLPSEAVLIHVFDINLRQFVVVRAFGASPQAVTLHRTPDREPMFQRVMRGTRSVVTKNASSEAAYRAERWGLLNVLPDVAIVGPVQQQGRFLGAIELANPLGGGAYTEHESHALDYICEQLADFLAARPIIVDADVVLGKH